MNHNARGKSIHWYLSLSWIIPCGFALAASIFIVIGLAWVEFQSEKTHTLSRLSEDSIAITRRISNELLLGTAGQPEKVRELLQNEFKLDSVGIRTGALNCSATQQNASCSGFENGSAFLEREVPFVNGKQVVRVSMKVAGVLQRIGNPFILWALLPWALFTMIGLMIQRRFLKAKFMDPLYQLVTVGPQQIQMNSDWPREVAALAKRLQDTFDDRDAAVFGQTVRGVVHDLRTRLQPLLLATELASSSKDGPMKTKAVNHLINCASDVLPKIRNLLDQALDAARGVQVDKKDDDIARTIQNAVQNLEDLVAKSKVTLSIDTAQVVTLKHDSAQLERAITNLIKNSIEATTEKSSTEKQVNLTLQKSDGELKLAIEDSGNGFSQETLRAKERGLKVSQSTKHHGIGIGISSAKQIVEAHGGELKLGKSEKLGGARSEIILKDTEAQP